MEIITYMCGNKLCAIETGNVPFDNDGPDSIIVGEGVIEVPMIPNSINPDNMFIEIEMVGETVYIPRICRQDETFEWEITWNEDNEESETITITFSNSSFCDWVRTVITGDHYGDIYIVDVGSGNDAIPEDFDDVFSGGNISSIDKDQLVPGEQIAMYYKFRTQEELQIVATDYIHSCCITGGYIIAVNGSYGDEAITYDVNIEGTVYTDLVPSDFYEYQVGDFVFVLKPSSNSCGECERGESCSGEDYDDYDNDGGIGILLPIKISTSVGDVGAS